MARLFEGFYDEHCPMGVRAVASRVESWWICGWIVLGTWPGSVENTGRRRKIRAAQMAQIFAGEPWLRELVVKRFLLKRKLKGT